jgi:hypothetical protein
MERNQLRSADEAIDQLDPDLFLKVDREVLVQRCLSLMGWPVPGQDHAELGQPHVHLDRSHVAGSSERLSVHVPYLDPANDLAEHVTKALTSHFGGSGRRQCGGSNVFTIDLNLAPGQQGRASWAHDFAALKQRVVAVIQDEVEKSNLRTDERRRAATENLRVGLTGRTLIAEALGDADLQLGVPVERTDQGSAVIVRPRGLDLARAIERASSGVPVVTLQTQVRDEILATIRNFGVALERLPRTASRLAALDEEALRDVLLFILNANWQVGTGEAFSGSGKTDICLWFRERIAFTAELKVYSGGKQIHSAIDQLSRYAVWRDTHAALVVFIKGRKDISTAMRRVREAIEQHPRVSGDNRDSAETLRYLLGTDDSERVLALEVVFVPLATAG